MRFSVIIPAHNAAGRIETMLKSIRAQHFTDYEIIVVCDACDDVTTSIGNLL